MKCCVGWKIVKGLRLLFPSFNSPLLSNENGQIKAQLFPALLLTSFCLLFGKRQKEGERLPIPRPFPYWRVGQTGLGWRWWVGRDRWRQGQGQGRETGTGHGIYPLCIKLSILMKERKYVTSPSCLLAQLPMTCQPSRQLNFKHEPC